MKVEGAGAGAGAGMERAMNLRLGIVPTVNPLKILAVLPWLFMRRRRRRRQRRRRKRKGGRE